MCTLVDNQDDRSSLGPNISSRLDQGQISNSMVVDSIDMDGTSMILDLTHVSTYDATVGSLIHESTPMFGAGVAGVNADAVGDWRNAIVSGRRNLGGLALRPAFMPLASVCLLYTSPSPRD